MLIYQSDATSNASNNLAIYYIKFEGHLAIGFSVHLKLGNDELS